jgi:hypothetical protein
MRRSLYITVLRVRGIINFWCRKFLIVLRKIYGPIKHQNGWRTRTYEELQVICRKPNILITLKVRRLAWVGHQVRLADDRTVKKVFVGKPDGRRKAGRPKLRWLDSVENGLKLVDIKRWGKKAEDRSVWAIILNEALVSYKDHTPKKKKNF